MWPFTKSDASDARSIFLERCQTDLRFLNAAQKNPKNVVAFHSQIPRLQQLPEILHTSGRDFTEKICTVFKQFFLKFSALPRKTGVQPFGSSDWLYSRFKLYSRFSSCFTWTSCELTFHLHQVSLRQIPGQKVLSRLLLLLSPHPMR